MLGNEWGGDRWDFCERGPLVPGKAGRSMLCPLYSKHDACLSLPEP